jgi:hypothetical protein
LLKDGKFRRETIIDQSDMKQLVEKMVSAKASVENVLGIEVRSDIHIKPVQQLGPLLGLVGLKLERVQTQKDQGRKIYRYRLEPDSFGRMKGDQATHDPGSGDDDVRSCFADHATHLYCP